MYFANLESVESSVNICDGVICGGLGYGHRARCLGMGELHLELCVCVCVCVWWHEISDSRKGGTILLIFEQATITVGESLRSGM